MKKVEAKIATPLGCGFIDAVKPDDVDIPRGMEIRHMCAGGRWHIHVKYVVERPEDLLTLKNTLDEIVRALQLIETTLREKS